MMRWIVCLLISFLAVACGDADSNPPRLEDQNNTNGEVGGTDYCEEFGWYGDGKCDDFCKLADPDCTGSPNPTNPPPVPDPIPEPSCAVPSPDRDYVGIGDECQLIDFACADGWSYFADECGCGCEMGPTPDPVCENLDVRGRPIWVDRDPEVCAVIRFTCADDQESFSGECGCGCIEPWNVNPPACLADSPDVERMGDVEECTRIDFACDEGWSYFQDDCGCGCVRGCSDDFECENGYCEQFVTCNEGDCPRPRPSECVYPSCDDGGPVACDALPPVCPAGQVAATVNGCYQCLDARTCAPPMGP